MSPLVDLKYFNVSRIITIAAVFRLTCSLVFEMYFLKLMNVSATMMEQEIT